MAQILEDTTVQLQRLDLANRTTLHHPAGLPRSSGIHLSGILRYLVLESGLLRYQPQLEDDDLPLRMALGFAWEEFAASLYPDLVWQPGELVEEGIAMNIDGLTALDASHLRIEEFKLTWTKAKSAADVLADQWYWLMQCRAYAWAYRTDTVRLHVCWINGDYRGSGPIYRRYQFRFDPRELETCKTMLLANAERATLKGYAESYPSTVHQSS